MRFIFHSSIVSRRIIFLDEGKKELMDIMTETNKLFCVLKNMLNF